MLIAAIRYLYLFDAITEKLNDSVHLELYLDLVKFQAFLITLVSFTYNVKLKVLSCI